MMQNWKLGTWHFVRKSWKRRERFRLKTFLSFFSISYHPRWKMVEFAWFCLSDLNCIKKTIRDATNGSEPNDFTEEMTHKQKEPIWQGRDISRRDGYKVHRNISVCVCVSELRSEWERSKRDRQQETWDLMRKGERGWKGQCSDCGIALAS